MTYDSSDSSWLLPVGIHYHHGNSTAASCVLCGRVEAVLLTGDKGLVHVGLWIYSFLLCLFVCLLVFARGETLWGHGPFPPQQALRWGVTQRGTPEQMVSVPLPLSGKKIRWDQKHSSLDDTPPGGTRLEEGANCAQISLTQFVMETLQACEPVFSAASFLSL